MLDNKNLNNNEYYLSYYSGMNNVNKEMKEYYLDILINNNKHVIDNINIILNNGYYYLYNMTYIKITEKETNILNNIINIISRYSEICKNINTKYMTTDEYRQFLECFTAIHLFDIENKILYKLHTHIFIHPYNDINIFQLKIDDINELFKSNNNIEGGGINTNINELFKANFKISNDYIKLDLNNITEEEFYDVSPYTVIQHNIFTILKEKYNDKTDNELCYITEGITKLLLIYYNYIGSISVDKQFLKYIIDEYESNNILSLSDFFDLYELHHNKIYSYRTPNIKNNLRKFLKHYNNTIMPISFKVSQLINNNRKTLKVYGGKRNLYKNKTRRIIK